MANPNIPKRTRKTLTQPVKNKIAKSAADLRGEIIASSLTPALKNRNLTAEHCELIIVRVSAGDSVAHVCKELGVSSGQVYQRAIDDPEFGRRLKIAREIGMHTQVDQMLTIASNDGEAVERSRLKIDVIKWLAARIGRHDYGDKPMTISAETLKIVLSQDDLDLC